VPISDNAPQQDRRCDQKAEWEPGAGKFLGQHRNRVPPTMHYYSRPMEVISIYPEWRGYDYILIGDQIVVNDPDAHEIVAVPEA